MSSWFIMRRDLSTKRRVFLTVLSFLFPLGLWALISMWLWQPDVRLDLVSRADNSTTHYTPGDRISKDFFPTFVAEIEADNTAIEEAQSSDESSDNGSDITVSRRENRRRLRALSSILVINQMISPDQTTDDEAIYGYWRDLSQDPSLLSRVALTSKNIDIIQKNWQLMNHGTLYDYDSLTTQPLLKLLPQGRLSSPIFLPTPVDVWNVGLQDFLGHENSDGTTMTDRVFIQ